MDIRQGGEFWENNKIEGEGMDIRNGVNSGKKIELKGRDGH